MADQAKATGIRNPLQLFGLYLAWTESALAGSLFAIPEHWSKHLLVTVMAIGALVYVSVVAYLLLHLAHKNPWFLYNPSDYDPSVQNRLFDKPIFQPGGFQIELQKVTPIAEPPQHGKNSNA